MKAVRCKQGKVFVVELEPPKGDGVRVKVASVGICGSDLHMLSTGYPIAVTLGHEMAGVTEDGTPVAIEPIAPCWHCPQCASGKYNLCDLGSQMVFGVGKDGGMAEELIVPEHALVPLPAGLAVENACLVEPLAVAVHGIQRAKLSGKDRVAIVGGGSLGLCAVAAAKGVTNDVCLLARHDAQRSAGARLGACLQADGVFDVVVDCAGTPAAMTTAVHLCRPGATLLMLASYWEGLTLPGLEVSMKELHLCPASMYCRQGPARDVDVAASLLATTPKIADCIITHRLPLDAAADAFELAAQREEGAIKVVLEPG